MDAMFKKIFRFPVKFVKNPKYFLFNNVDTKQTVAKNMFWLALADGVARFAKALILIFIANKLGAVEYGKFSFALSFVALFAFLSDLNISKLVTREIAKDKNKESDVPSILSLEILLSVMTFIVIFFASLVVVSDRVLLPLFWIVGVYYLVNIFSQIYYAVFRAHDKLEYQSWLEMSKTLVTVVAAFVVLYIHPSIMSLAYVYAGAAAVALIIASIFFHYRGVPLRLAWDTKVWRMYFKVSWPLVVAGICATVSTNFATTALGALRNYEQAGWYDGVQRLIGVAFIPITYASVSLFSVLSRFWANSMEKLKDVYNKYIVLIFFYTIPIIVGSFVVSVQLIKATFGDTFLPAASIFQLVAVSGAIAMWFLPISQVMVAANLQKQVLFVQACGTMLMVVLGGILVARYSFVGAAIAQLAAHIFQCVIYGILAHRHVSSALISSDTRKKVVQMVIAGVGMGCIISMNVITQMPVVVVILAGALIYTCLYVLVHVCVSRIHVLSLKDGNL